MKITKEQIRELIKLVRNKYNRSVIIYDFFGIPKGNKNLPLYYSDTKKFCFPQSYYSKEDILGVKKLLEDEIKKNDWDVKVEVEDKYYIGG